MEADHNSHEDAMFGVVFLSETESFHKYKKNNNNLIEVWKKRLSTLSCCFLFQKRILISFEFNNMRELFGFARMQTNLNKFKGHSEGKRIASCVVLF